MHREERRLVRYRAMFRHYLDALTPSQIQGTLGIGQQMTYDLLRNGRTHSVRVGRLYRIPKVTVVDCSREAEERT